MTTKTLSVTTATERLTALLAKLAKVGAENNARTTTLDEVRRVLANPATDPVSRRRAHCALADAERQQFSTETELMDTSKAVAEARDKQREAFVADAMQALRDDAHVVDTALTVMTEAITRMQATEMAVREQTQQVFGPYTFQLPDPEHWRAHVRAAGLLK